MRQSEPVRIASAASGWSKAGRSKSWRPGAGWANLMAMGTMNFDTSSPSETETEAARQRRIVREAAMIAEADADIEAGRLVDEAAVDAWIDSIGTRHELPVPGTGR